MLSTTASETALPSTRDTAPSAISTSEDTASANTPDDIASIAAVIASLASASSALCLAEDTIASAPTEILPSMKSSSTTRQIASLASSGDAVADTAIARSNPSGHTGAKPAPILSTLLYIAIFAAELFCTDSAISLSIPKAASATARMSSLSSSCESERSMPIFSTGSALSALIPAVSARRSVTLPRVTVSSRTSRVVPAISVTIAASLPQRML